MPGIESSDFSKEETSHEKYQADMQEFRDYAVEGAPDPAHPDLVNRVRQFYLQELDKITDSNEAARQHAALIAASERVNKYIDISRSPGDVQRTTPESIAASLKTYFGIDA